MPEEKMEKVFSIILEKYKPAHANKAGLLMEYLENLGDWRFEGILEKPCGSKQTLDTALPWTKFEWVNQYENGGYNGDSYSGYTYVPLGRKAYLVFHYNS